MNYTGAAGTVTWADGETGVKAISVNLIDNVTVAADLEAGSRAEQSPTGAPGKQPVLGRRLASLTISNDDFFGQLAFTSSDFYVNENGGSFIVTVERLAGMAEEVSVRYEVYSTAAPWPDADYVARHRCTRVCAGSD